MPIEEKIDSLSHIKKELHSISPFRNEPVDCVLWEKQTIIHANDYNPNAVAPPEMKLLEQSIREDFYTQPIVSWKHDEGIEVVDGFHRNIVGRDNEDIRERMFGRLPVVNINESTDSKSDRMSSTIRHNRARGSHNIELMSTIISELVEMGKGDRWIIKASRTLGGGEKASSVNILTYVDPNTFKWQSIGREIAGELLPNIEEVTVVREQSSK